MRKKINLSLLSEDQVLELKKILYNHYSDVKTSFDEGIMNFFWPGYGTTSVTIYEGGEILIEGHDSVSVSEVYNWVEKHSVLDLNKPAEVFEYFEGGEFGEKNKFYKWIVKPSKDHSESNFVEVSSEEYFRNIFKVVKEEQILSGFLKVIKAEIEHTLPSGEKLNYPRSKVEREDAVGIVVENTQTGKLLFVRQHRYPVGDKTDPMMLEIVAGRIEKNQTPMETALREIEEEIGYRPNSIEYLTYYFTSPGYSSERIYLFYAKVDSNDKISNGGGLLTENEFIQIEEYTSDEVLEMLANEKITDGKTQMALLMVLNKK